MIPARPARLCAAATPAVAAAAVVLMLLGPPRSQPADVFGGAGGLSFLLAALAFASVGAILVARVPGNRLGGVFCLTGLAYGATVLGWQYADYGLNAVADSLPGAALAASAPSEAIAGLPALVVLLFPDGRLPGPRWRVAATVLLAAMALLLASDVLRPGPLDDPFARASNPLGVPGWRSAMDALNLAGWALVVVGMMAAAASMVVRWRRARGIERQQLKVVLAVGALTAAVVGLDMLSWLLWPEGRLQLRMAVLGVCFAAFPVAAGVAILRYRLYDIDVVINRALVYGALTATLAVAYLGSVLLLQLVLSPSSSLAVAISTLAVAALVRPARARLQAAVDRRFYRRRYDARRTLESFSARLRDEVDLGRLDAELRAVVDEALQPASVSLWLRPR